MARTRRRYSRYRKLVFVSQAAGGGNAIDRITGLDLNSYNATEHVKDALAGIEGH